MLIQKDLAELVEKYSFIKKAIIEGIFLIIEYENEGKLIRKRLPRRASVQQLQRMLKTIEKQVIKTPFGKGLHSGIQIVTIGEEE